MKKIFFSIIMFITVVFANAHDFEVDGIYYNITSETEPYTVEVTFKGSSYSSITNEYSGEVIIPETVTYNEISYDVTSIKRYAFAKCTKLTSVKTNNNIITIEESAFNGCSGLTDIVISGSVTSIGNYAFKSCKSLKNVYFEDGTETLELGYNYYYAGGTMDAIHIDANGIFQNCSLETLYLGRNLSYVTSDCGAPFYGQTTLSKVTIGETVTSIGTKCFYNCTGLNSVNISSLESWCQIDFTGTFSHPHDLYLNGSLLNEIEIPSEITSIKKYAFYNCNNIVSVILHEGITSIEKSAFNNCDNIAHVYAHPTLPPSLSSDGFGTTTYENAILYVYEDAENSYRNAENWQNFFNISATLDDTPTTIENIAESDIKVYANDGVVSILGVNETVESIIYDIHGIKVYQGTDKEIHLDRKGIFLLSVNGKTFKFLL